MTSTAPFRLLVEGVFHISERGTGVIGPILRGEASIGDVLAVEGRDTGPQAAIVGIDAAPRARRTLEDGLPRVGLIVTDWSKDDVFEGDVLIVVGLADGAARSAPSCRGKRVADNYDAAPVLPRPSSMLSKHRAAVRAVVVDLTLSASAIVMGRVTESPEA